MQSYETIIKALEMMEDGYSTREIREMLHIGGSTLSLIKERFQLLDKTFQDYKDLPSSKAIDAIYQKTRSRDKDKPLPDYQKIYDRLNAKGSRANLYFLWLEYKRANPTGYQYTQFKFHFRKWQKDNGLCKKKATMPIERVPGQIVYIDWVGDTLNCVVNDDNKPIKAHFFVTTVGVSSYLYARAYPDEKLSNFTDGVIRALYFYGALPNILKPDNLKAAICKNTKDELIVNATFRDIENFYGLIVLPPPPLKPRGKATVESGVRFLETHIIERLKDKVFHSFDELNGAIDIYVKDLNDLPHDGGPSRKELFLAYDRPKMRSLPNGHFRVYDYRARTVPNNYHLEYDNHYYSVPYTMIGQEVILRANIFHVTIVDKDNKLICSHERLYNRDKKYVTIKEHMPDEHKFYHDVNNHDGRFYRKWASDIGSYMCNFIDRLLRSYEYEPQGYRSANGILWLTKDYPRNIANEVAKECLESGNVRYTYFKKSLMAYGKKEKSQKVDDTLPLHSNIRGKDNYK